MMLSSEGTRTLHSGEDTTVGHCILGRILSPETHFYRTLLDFFFLTDFYVSVKQETQQIPLCVTTLCFGNSRENRDKHLKSAF